jgi:enamine deaminase RidA (YjgF/YER057c/UK114 family)
VVGDQVFISGITAGGPDGIEGGDSMEAQARTVYTRIKHLMEAAGGTMDDIVRLLTFVTDISRRDEILRVRREFFPGVTDYPTSTLVEVSALVVPGLLIEVEAQAVLGAGRR